MMQSYLRNALLAIVALAAFATTFNTTASAQSVGSVTVTVNEPTEIGGTLLAPGAYNLRHSSGDWYLTLEDAGSRRVLGFIRYESTVERQGNEAQVTTAALDAGAPAKLAITSVYIPATGRAYSFPVNECTASAADSAGK